MGGEAIKQGETPTTIKAALPAPVLMLFQRPEVVIVTGGKRVDPGALAVAAPKKQSWEWINRVIDSSWLPPMNAEMAFLSKEFDDRDVTRIGWEHDDYHIEVSQTASIFAMRLVSRGNNGTGRDSTRRLENARQLCLKVFNREGRMWTQDTQGAGRPVVVHGLKESIAEACFDPARVKELPSDKVVVGVDWSMEDEGVASSTAGDEPSAVGPPRPGTPEASHYWFRNVSWWNDGKAIGFYFLKLDGPGSWVPSFVGEIDKNWFHDPKDRMGRPVPVRGE